MIVVVETNFVIELVLQQEQSTACEEILALCSSSAAAQLAIPAFSVIEAGTTFERIRGQRRVFVQQDVSRFARESGRAKILQRFEKIVRELDAELVRAEIDEAARWLDFRVRTLAGMVVISINGDMLEETVALELGREIDRFPDAVVFASVKAYLAKIRASDADQPACFVSRDKKAFRRSVLVKQLHRLNCAYIDSFDSAVAYIQQTLG
jgi:hypothetical protein